jgi:trk system potassium uptake protein
MLTRLARAPVPVVLLGAAGLAMLIPSAHAFLEREPGIGRAFLYSGIVNVLLALLLAIALSGGQGRRQVNALLPLFVVTYLLLPVALALPVVEAVPGMRYFDAWFEMVSCFTTTGATLLDVSGMAAPSVHLWRGLVAWFGGLFILVAAMALLAPLGLGGFEVIRERAQVPLMRADAGDDVALRLRQQLILVLPPYLGVTVLAWALLTSLGVPGLEALMQAMAALSTSGVLMPRGLGPIGLGAEIVLFVALLPALSLRLRPGPRGFERFDPRRDPELGTAVLIILVVVLIVMVRHVFASAQLPGEEAFPALGRAVWGTAFNGLSFLTTAGLISQDWVTMRIWSGLAPPGLVLLGLALMGGGVATTAGGVKLLRMRALARMGRVEVERLVYPSMVIGGGDEARLLATRGARAAWLLAMVFAITGVGLVAVLMLLGLRFETALIFAIAALTTTGPLAQVAGEVPLMWSALSDSVRAVLAVTMILGRLEILVLVALVMARLGRN